LLFALSLLPLRVIHEINQDWPLITWPYATIIVGFTLYAFYLAGGWPWVRHFAFPVAFILVSITWPYRIENTLIHGLMQSVAGVTVEILGWFNIPALQRGSLVEVSAGVVSVDEACSGIRSLQSSLMGALFLGELYLLRWRSRGLLIAAGLIIAFCLNVVRTVILSWHAARSGITSLDNWHDPAGLMILGICFICLWAIAGLLKSRLDHRTSDLRPLTPDSCPLTSVALPLCGSTAPTPDFQSPPSASNSLSASGGEGRGEVVPSASLFGFQLSAFSFPRWFSLSFPIWIAFVLIANETWYRIHELKPTPTAHWWVNLPTNAPSYREVGMSKFARGLLKHDEGVAGSWKAEDGTDWSVFCFRWAAGDATARMSARGHRPEYCLVGSGHEMNADLGTIHISANGLNLPFRTYLFDAPQRPVYIFFCLWEDGSERQRGFAKTKYHDRLRSVLDGRRGLGQQTLEIICHGYASVAEAQQAVQDQLPRLIQIDRRSQAHDPQTDEWKTASEENRVSEAHG
jgi:exosortase